MDMICCQFLFSFKAVSALLVALRMDLMLYHRILSAYPQARNDMEIQKQPEDQRCIQNKQQGSHLA